MSPVLELVCVVYFIMITFTNLCLKLVLTFNLAFYHGSVHFEVALLSQLIQTLMIQVSIALL